MCNAYCLKWDVALNYTNEGKQIFLSDMRPPQLSWPKTLSLLRYYSIKRYVPVITIWKTNHVLCLSDCNDGAGVEHNKANKLN